jgi:signal transduction histidine kinase
MSSKLQTDLRVALLVTADSTLARCIIASLTGNGFAYHLPIAVNPAQAREQLQNLRDAAGEAPIAPCAILMDESAIEPAEWAACVYELARLAPLVLVSGASRLEILLHPAPAVDSPAAALDRPERADLRRLLAAGAVEWVPRTEFAAEIAVALLRRHAGRATSDSLAELAAQSPDVVRFRGESREFSEILRHEINNPLTGILGNAELLLARRGRLPEAVIARLETIAQLAVRLRETIRQLSEACEQSLALQQAHSTRRPRLVR